MGFNEKGSREVGNVVDKDEGLEMEKWNQRE